MAPSWRRGASVAWVGSPGRGVLLQLDRLSDPPLVIEGSAAEIWLRLDGARDLSDIVDELTHLYGEDRAVIEPAVMDFLTELRGRGLVEAVLDE